MNWLKKFQTISGWRNYMGKKKREHIVFDQMLKLKNNIPFSKVNKQNNKNLRLFGVAKH
jgi:hypothetical protein